MSRFEFALLCGLVIVVLLSWGRAREMVWLTAGAVDYIATSIYYAYGLPSHAFFTLLMDALVCFALIVKWEHRWEAVLCWIFGISAAIDLGRLFLLIDSHAYATGLELANWAALLTIGGPRLIELADVGLDIAGHRSRYLRSANIFFAASRHPPPRWKS